jgi:hypothetical protein
MSNKTATLMLAFLVIAGVLAIYQEASAILMPCDYVEMVCNNNCLGTFVLGDCYTYDYGIWCVFECKDFQRDPYEWPCEWPDPTYGNCKLS